LQRLLAFLSADTGNAQLLADAASAAFDDQKYDLAQQLVERREAVEPLTAELVNLKGMIALARQHFDAAATAFEILLATSGSDPALKFNLAWAKAMTNQWPAALALLDEATLAASPRAPSLKIHAMHHLNMYEEGLAAGEHLAQRFPDNHALMGALATLAMDAEKPDLALQYAKRAGQDPEGEAALGFLLLGENNAIQSMELFDRAISAQPGSPRAWLGKGLSLLASGQAESAADAIDRGAEMFGTHLGSWVASGWAHFIAGDRAKARASFERAISVDPNFSESHGGLAVLDVAEGRIQAAKRECEIALRLDKNCFGGALAKSLLLQQGGHAQAAQKVREMAMSVPIGVKGQTIAQALAGMAGGKPR
jgi:tetratricopeptide (TPR) repeat protein